MKVLVFTSLFPNDIQTHHGVFVANRLRYLVAKYPEIELKVVAPVPWFPFKHKMFGAYSDFARVSKKQDLGWTQVFYPRVPIIPKIGMNIAPYLMAVWVYPHLKRLINNGFTFDFIDAHFLYPDAVAAAMLAQWLNKPLICTARGSDISEYTNYVFPRKLIGNTIAKSQCIVTVCQALADEINNLGYKPKEMLVARNGVELDTFKPLCNREELRSKFGLDKFTLISVGLLIERKGHHIILQALRDMPDVELLLAGDGPMKKQLRNLAIELGIDNQVHFLGPVKHEKLVEYYNLADALVLASSREGWANVLLEAMACGTPVVATNVWGTPEIVRESPAGVLVERTVDGIATGIREIIKKDRNRSAVRSYAEKFSWDETIDSLATLFEKINKQNNRLDVN